MAYRGLYHQAEGNEHRRQSEAAAEYYADSDLIEGQEVKILNAMMKQGRWDSTTKHIDGLRLKGWSQSRIDSVISRAKFGLRF